LFWSDNCREIIIFGILSTIILGLDFERITWWSFGPEISVDIDLDFLVISFTLGILGTTFPILRLTGKELGNLAEDMKDVEFGVPSDVPVDRIDEMLSQLHLISAPTKFKILIVSFIMKTIKQN
jgi:hypothetical protein